MKTAEGARSFAERLTGGVIGALLALGLHEAVF